MPAAHASPDDIDLTSVWGALLRRLPRILLASLLAGGLTFGVLAMVAPKYSSEAQLAILAKGSSADPLREGAGTPDAVVVRMDKEAINTHVKALQSTDLAQVIIAELALDKKPEFNSAAGSPDMLSRLLRIAGIGAPKKSESDLDRTLTSYFRLLQVYSPKESRSIDIQFTSIDPELAKTVANLVAERYREQLSRQSGAEAVQVESDLEPKIAKLKEELAAADAEVKRLQGEFDIFNTASKQGTLNEQQLGELTAELSKVKAARSEAEARAKSAREMMKIGSADALPDVQKSPLIQSLVQQRVRLEREIAEAGASLLPGHPRMRQLSAELAGLKKQLNAEVSKVVDSLEKEAKVTALREASLDKSLSDLKTRVVAVAPDEGKLRNLMASADAKRAELVKLEQKSESARTLAASRAIPVEAKILSQARASTVSVGPKKLQLSLLSSLAIFILGTAISLIGALRRSARREDAAPPARPAGKYAGAPTVRAEPVLVSSGPVPRHGPPAVPAAAGPLHGERGLRMTSMASVAQHLETHAPQSGGCRALVVGESAAIDASTEAVELVGELAERGHAAILIDWSPDGSGLAQKLGLARTPGITELLSGAARFEDVVQRLPQGEGHFIACGAAQRYASDGGPNADELNLVLDALDEAYSHIVVVGPHEQARELFEAIEGRFDAGITVADGKKRVTVIQDPPGTFLGFEVADIELIRFDRAAAAGAAGQRIVRTDAGAEARV